MTTPDTTTNATFYFVYPEGMIEDLPPESSPVTFSLPAGTKFPDDLTPIMNKTNRFFSFQNSFVYGKTSPSCGDNCDCSNCSSLVEECEGKRCKGFVSSVEKIQCQRDGCVKSNETTFYMMPLYPVTFSLPFYDPKFKFIKLFPPQTIENTPENISFYKQIEPEASTLPSEFQNLEPMALFGVSYPSLDLFDTEDKFYELFELCKFSSVFFSLLKQDKYIKHNNNVLQEVLKINKLPPTLLNQKLLARFDNREDTEKRRLIDENTNKQREEWSRKVRTITPNVLGKSPYEKKVQAHYQRQFDFRHRLSSDVNSGPLRMNVVEPGTNVPMEIRVKEGYDDIPLKNLVIPKSVQDNDAIPNTPESSIVTTNKISTTNKPSTATPSSKKKMSGLTIFGIVVVVIIVLVMLFYFFSKKSKKKSTQSR